MADRIGDNLVKIGAMTQEQVKEVLQRQKDGDSRPFRRDCYRAFVYR